MRTTIDLPADLHQLTTALAHDRKQTLSQTIADVLRRALLPEAAPAVSLDPRSGLPIVRLGHTGNPRALSGPTGPRRSERAGDARCTVWPRHARHVFWPDDRPYDGVALRGVIGHRQVIDGYLAALSRAGTADWLPLTRASRSPTATSSCCCLTR